SWKFALCLRTIPTSNTTRQNPVRSAGIAGFHRLHNKCLQPTAPEEQAPPAWSLASVLLNAVRRILPKSVGDGEGARRRVTMMIAGAGPLVRSLASDGRFIHHSQT